MKLIVQILILLWSWSNSFGYTVNLVSFESGTYGRLPYSLKPVYGGNIENYTRQANDIQVGTMTLQFSYHEIGGDDGAAIELARKEAANHGTDVFYYVSGTIYTETGNIASSTFRIIRTQKVQLAEIAIREEKFRTEENIRKGDEESDRNLERGKQLYIVEYLEKSSSFYSKISSIWHADSILNTIANLKLKRKAMNDTTKDPIRHYRDTITGTWKYTIEGIYSLSLEPITSKITQLFQTDYQALRAEYPLIRNKLESCKLSPIFKNDYDQPFFNVCPNTLLADSTQSNIEKHVKERLHQIYNQ